LETFNVRTLLLPVAGLRLKLAVAPLGTPEVENVTGPVKPPMGVIVIVLVPLLPRLMVNAFGLAVKLKSCAAGTVSIIVVVWLRVPLVPVTVTVVALGGAVPETVNVNTLPVPVPLVGLGVKLALTPEGNVLVLKVICPAKPPVRAIVIVLVPLFPGFTVRLFGLADREKSPPPPLPTVSVRIALCTSDPLVPVIFIGNVPWVAFA